MDVTETMLPGVGVRYEFRTRRGENLGLIAYRDGRIDLLVCNAEDPDVCDAVMQLTRAEAETVAELLGAPRIAERMADLSKEIPGLVATQIDLPDGSAYIGQPLGSTRTRTRTGASIVAIVRGDDVVTAPGPEVTLERGDVLVVIGTEDGVLQVRRLLGATRL